MKHRLFTFAAAASLAAFVATGGLWASSLRWEMFCEHTSFSPYGAHWYWLNRQVWSEDGFLRWASTGVEVNTPNFESTWDEKPGQWDSRVRPLGTSGPAMGFPQNLRPRWDSATGVFGPTRPEVVRSCSVGIILPYWCVLLLTLPLPIAWAFLRRRLDRRRGLRLCLDCGYSLHANTSGVCPECGRPTTWTSE